MKVHVFPLEHARALGPVGEYISEVKIENEACDLAG